MRTVILCVNSVWHPDPATVPPAETQGNIEYTSCGILSDKGLSFQHPWRKNLSSWLQDKICTNCTVV